jgi:3-methyladenine DNA glycosylase Tag
MTRVIFLAGLSWKMIDKKWSSFKRAIRNFSIKRVADFDETNLQQLVSDRSIVRNRAKIKATIENAKRFQKATQEHGSFQRFLDSLDKSNNYTFVIKELGKRFRRIGPSSARIFLYSVGETIRQPME